MNMDREYIDALYLYLFFAKFCAINVSISLSDWTPNGECFGTHKYLLAQITLPE